MGRGVVTPGDRITEVLLMNISWISAHRHRPHLPTERAGIGGEPKLGDAALRVVVGASGLEPPHAGL